MKLRDYQTTAVEAAMKDFEEVRSVLWVMPTGTGKTIAFASVAQRFAGKGRVLILAHRAELIFQAVERIKDSVDLHCDIEMAELRADQVGFWTAPVIVSTIQTQTAGFNGYRRCSRFAPGEFSLVIVDEAHHATAKSYRAVLDHYMANEKLRVLGVTATPDRADESALGQVFERVSFEYGIVDAISDGWLVPIEQQFVECEHLDFAKCRTTAGDLNGGDLAKVMEYEAALHEVVGPTLEIVGDRKALVFAASVAHAERMAEIINRERQHAACFVHAGTPRDERAALIAGYRSGEYQYLVNVGIATEGFDIPDVEVVVLARPTKSRALYAQMIGRGTRTLPGLVDGLETADERRAAIAASGKPTMTALDFVGNSGTHKLISTLSILGGIYEDDVAELAVREATESGKPIDVMDALKIAERKQREARIRAEQDRRKHVRSTTKHRKRKVDPFDVFDVSPRREPAYHQGRQPSDRQIEVLQKFKVPIEEDLTFARASQLLDICIGRAKRKLCSFGQAKVLRRNRIDPENVGFKEASAMIDVIAKRQGWGKQK